MTVISLIANLRSLIGDEDSTNYRYSDNVLRDTKIPAGTKRFNLLNFQRFLITGVSDAKVFDPTPVAEEASRINLHTAISILNGEIQKAAHNSVVVTNPAGRTDLTKVVGALQTQRDNLKIELKEYENGVTFGKIADDIDTDDEKF